MSRKMLHGLVRSAVVLCAAVGPAAAQGGSDAPALFDEAALHGDWVSEGGCEIQQPAPGGTPSHFRRAYHFEADGTWWMLRTIYADPACRSPLLTLRLAGRYHLGPPSAAVNGAREAELRFDAFHVTPESAAALPMLAGCGTEPWKVGLQQDVGGTGCPGLRFQPLAQCGVDHDIVQIRDDALYPGARTPDMCTPGGRPTSLQQTGPKRVS